MNVSRLTFTKETKEKMEKPLTRQQTGELRWKILKEIADTGKLSKARNRQDILGMMGLPQGYGAPYTWISAKIKQGYVSETLLGFDNTSTPEYEYHIVGNPEFKQRGGKKKQADKPVLTPTKPITEPIVLSRAYTPTEGISATIKYGELSIELRNLDSNTIERIVEKLANI